jgi:Glycosyltransferases involved in cell wall biogenesis
MGVSVVLLAYKEAENLRILLPQIKKYITELDVDYEIIVVDTKEAMDDTRTVCIENEVKYVNQEEDFFGGAFRTGIKYASKDIFLILDSDGSHDPSKIPEIYSKFITGADVVIGSRYIKGGKTNDSISSVVMSKILNTIFRMCLGIKAKDISTNYRMYHTSQLKKVVLSCRNYDVLEEVLLKLKIQKQDFIIKEIPIEFKKRVFGESKRNLIPFVVSYIKTLIRLFNMRINNTKEETL